MRFATPLVPATLIRRYKRFLSDIVLDDGREVTAHCPNPGAMTGLAAPGMRIWVEPNDDPKKKLKFGWRLTELSGGHMAGIDTGVPNRVVGEALRAGLVPGLAGDVRAEVKYGTNSRVDFLVSCGGLDTYVEVKNCHLRRTGTLAEFPDCVTLRGAKHMNELAEMVQQGHRAVLVFLVQRTDCDASPWPPISTPVMPAPSRRRAPQGSKSWPSRPASRPKASRRGRPCRWTVDNSAARA